MLSKGIAGPGHQPRFIIKQHSNQARVGKEHEVDGLNKVNPRFCKISIFRSVSKDERCVVSLFLWHLVKSELWWKQFLPSSWMRIETLPSESDWVPEHAARQGWLLLHQGVVCFLGMFVQFNCAAAEATDTYTKKPQTHKTPSLRPLRPLVYFIQVMSATRYCQISVFFGPEGWRDLESCLHCWQCS